MTIKRCYPVLVGASVAENQLKNISSVSSGTVNGVTFTNNGDGSVTASGTATADTQFDLGVSTLSPNHKYLIIGCPSGGSASTYYMGNASYTDTGNGKIFDSGSASATGYRIYVQNGVQINKTFYPQLIDLTQKFGSSIADHAYTLEQATAGSGIAWLRSYGFLGGYKAYNAGSIESVEVTEKKCVGFNQWDEEWENGYINDAGQNSALATALRSKNYISVIPNTSYFVCCPRTVFVFYYDDNKNFITKDATHGSGGNLRNEAFTIPQNVHYMRFTMYDTPTYNNDICINLSDLSRNGEYKPYKSTTYPLGSDTLRGIFKLDANNQLYADGDRKEADGMITRKYGVVDLGTLNWYKVMDYFFRVDYEYVKPCQNNIVANIICPKYKTVMGNEFDNTDKTIAVLNNSSNFYVHDTAYNDIASFKTAMSGVMLVYELATPTTETSTPFISPQICYPEGTEAFVTGNGVPVGHETKYQL